MNQHFMKFARLLEKFMKRFRASLIRQFESFLCAIFLLSSSLFLFFSEVRPSFLQKIRTMKVSTIFSNTSVFFFLFSFYFFFTTHFYYWVFFCWPFSFSTQFYLFKTNSFLTRVPTTIFCRASLTTQPRITG